MSRTYAIADTHGRYDLLTEALAKIIDHSKDARPSTIVTLGDYVDRGPQSRQIIERLMEWQLPDLRLVSLKGNHETMMVETLRKPLHPDWWIGNGGGQTLISYGHAPEGEYDPTVIPDDHIEWIDNLPMMYRDEHRVYVHAAVDETVSLDEQTEETLTWRRYPEGYAAGHGSFHVVHGHDQFAEGPLRFPGRTNLDVFAWYTGRLVIGVFDDATPGGPIEIIEVIGERAKARGARRR